MIALRKFVLILLLVLTGCAPAVRAGSPTAVENAARPSETLPAGEPSAAPGGGEATTPAVETAALEPTAAPSPTAEATGPALGAPTPAANATAAPDTRKPPKYWAEWPLVPTVSEQAKAIFQRGLANGLDVHSFSTIGDCQSQPPIFMGIYDTDRYRLPAGYASLQETIDQFRGSFNRDDITVKDGNSVISVFSPLWADPKQCNAGETPLDCEFRLHKPIIVFINLGTNWLGGDEKKHEQYMRKIVDAVIAKGAVPILSSKGDNLEGGHRINESTARVAYDYNLPFWNFWLSIRDLPGKGIDGTKPGGYLIPEAWDRRSFTGLRALDAVWRAIKSTLTAPMQ